MPLPFELRTLEIFLAVCEQGAMMAAAKQLGITQSAVSQSIAELESRTGAQLFDRAVRPLGLTAAGLLLRQRASGLLAEAREISPLLRELQRGRVRLLRLGLVDSLARAVIPALSAHLAPIADEVSFFSGLTASHAAALLSRQLDLVLGADEMEDIEALERFVLVEEPYVLIGPPGWKAPASVEALRELPSELPLLRFSARSKTGIEVERHLRRLGINLPRSQEFDAPLGLAGAVAKGVGWAVTTPLCLHEAALPREALSVGPLPGPSFRRRMILLARRKELGGIPRELAQVASAALAEVMDKMQGWIGS